MSFWMDVNQKLAYEALFSWREWSCKGDSGLSSLCTLQVTQVLAIYILFQFQHAVWNCRSPNSDAVS
jgi:hypothetical protein